MSNFKKNIMRILLVVLFMSLGFLLNAQDVSFNGVTYEIKKDRIFKDSVDVTDVLSVDEKAEIRAAFDKKMTQIAASEETKKRIEKAEKEQEKAEKDQKRAEKKQKKAEKALKKKEKAQSNFDKSTKKHKDAIKKYEKLKKKGKLSPQDEEKWLEKINKYKEASAKAKKKLK
ncbi:hypothetical protein DIS18_03390 [Algibacter marinivivus]|uniref:Uncharacterized protein n=2 Tax=Algibacter marinivivus TaxID=2100723 RepID=A0A2U2X784_9FLAO|nr:hypothetical protein DIS18_03390 [Algibacter marinivivus]